MSKTIFIFITVAFLVAISIKVFAVPVGPIITHLSNSSLDNTAGVMRNDTKGQVINVNLNSTQQTRLWKAYIGNVTGRLTLDDAENYTVYDWGLTNIAGEVYATKNSNTVSWTNVICANVTHLNQEEYEMNHTSSGATNNISNTFTGIEHAAFVAGSVAFSQSACNHTIATYVNDSSQGAVTATSKFQEILLTDGTDLIYTTILERDYSGYRTGFTYDFQLLVAENEQIQANTAYYFYVELS